MFANTWLQSEDNTVDSSLPQNPIQNLSLQDHPAMKEESKFTNKVQWVPLPPDGCTLQKCQRFVGQGLL